MRYFVTFCCVVNFREEWEWLRRLSTNEVNAPPTPTQTTFHNSLVSACKKLLDNLGKRTTNSHELTMFLSLQL